MKAVVKMEELGRTKGNGMAVFRIGLRVLKIKNSPES